MRGLPNAHGDPRGQDTACCGSSRGQRVRRDSVTLLSLQEVEHAVFLGRLGTES